MYVCGISLWIRVCLMRFALLVCFIYFFSFWSFMFCDWKEDCDILLLLLELGYCYCCCCFKLFHLWSEGRKRERWRESLVGSLGLGELGTWKAFESGRVQVQVQVGKWEKLNWLSLYVWIHQLYDFVDWIGIPFLSHEYLWTQA